MSKENILMYNYSWGDEDVLSSQITVTRTIDKYMSNYEIVFTQEGFYEDCFLDITTPYKLIEKTVSNSNNVECMNVRTITLKVEISLNPPPESLFKIIEN